MTTTRTAMIRPAWTPATIALMVLGFVFFWPLGLAMLAYILWGDRLDGAAGEVRRAADGMFAGCRKHHRHVSSTGNIAFDEWRETELERLAEERRKLDAMRQEFDEYVRELRRARDRDEFDRFMNARNSNAAGPQTDTGPMTQA